MAKQTQAQKTMAILNSPEFQAQIAQLATDMIAMVNETDADTKRAMCDALNKAQCDLAYTNKMMPQLISMESEKAKVRLLKSGLVKVGA